MIRRGQNAHSHTFKEGQHQENTTPKTLEQSKILTVEDLTIDFLRTIPSGSTIEPVRVVDHINFAITKGETLAIVGESGSGKTVTALTILQLLRHTTRVQVGGVITLTLTLPADDDLISGAHSGTTNVSEPKMIGNSLWCTNNIDLTAQSEQVLTGIRGRHVGVIFQDARDSLNPLQKIGKQLDEAIWSHTHKEERCRELLSVVELDDKRIINSYPHELSGGQRQRILIAMALANNPQFLIADEPTSAVDPPTGQQIIRLLQSIQKSQSMTTLIIDHNMSNVGQIADSVIVMRTGKIVEMGKKTNILNNPSHDYTQQLVKATPLNNVPSPAAHAPIALKVQDLSVRYKMRGWLKSQHFTAAHGVNIELRKGETLGIAGFSGSGKTSVAMALLRLIDCQGTISLYNQPWHQLKGKELRAMRHMIQVVFQDPFSSLSPRMAVAHIISEGLYRYQPKITDQEADEAVITIMEELKLNPRERFLYPHEFSGGERQRIAIARAMIINPQVVIYDEPTSALDTTTQNDLLTLLRDIQDRNGLTYVFISHNFSILRAITNKIIVMDQGNVVEEGESATVIESPQHPTTQKLLTNMLWKNNQ